MSFCLKPSMVKVYGSKEDIIFASSGALAEVPIQKEKSFTPFSNLKRASNIWKYIE